ncbi:hypothetical protein MUP01_13980 [Candidatus Bathyarchaeota archaeon]|nr:hypothetical protein [Candidatus Bathyarchaeota archaeon]
MGGFWCCPQLIAVVAVVLLQDSLMENLSVQDFHARVSSHLTLFYYEHLFKDAGRFTAFQYPTPLQGGIQLVGECFAFHGEPASSVKFKRLSIVSVASTTSETVLGFKCQVVAFGNRNRCFFLILWLN